MELDELRTSWEQLSEKVGQQGRLNAKLIEHMTSHHYQSRLNKIAWPEWIGSLGCLGMAGWLIADYSKLDTTVLRILGILSLLFLAVLPALSLWSIRGLQKIDMGSASYANTLRTFTLRKLRFQRVQKINAGLSFLFMIAYMPVVVRVMDGKEITQRLSFWLVMIPCSLLFLLFFSRWVLNHYNHTLEKAETLLSDMEP